MLPISDRQRLHIEVLLNLKDNNADSGSDVIKGLTQTQKSLPPRYFYDDRGSQLFEKICQLPEYYPTRTETAILQEYAPEIAKLTSVCELVELGSGSSTKTRLLLDAYSKLGSPLHYIPIDVSQGILSQSARCLSIDYPNLEVFGLVGTYSQALAKLSSPKKNQRLIFFLGSSLGNFNPQECDRFFSEIKTALKSGDYFLLGVDLQKSIEVLEAAYNDSLGVTAAFNLNMLQHLNWRFQGNFELNNFEHRSFYNVSKSQIEMHLVSLRSHFVRLEALDLTIDFQAGETILTEISRKFNLHSMQKYFEDRGFKIVSSLSDPNNWFGLILAQLI
ncbi:MAG: L-histidine N(alpha)-methyltransferase [Prochloraceae cyanobacterium]